METLLGMLFERATIFGHTYALQNPKYATVGTALPYVVVTIFGGLYVIALLLGARELWRKATRYSVLHAHIEQMHRDVEAATVIEQGGGRNAPEQHADGRWYVNRYDADTGEVVGKKIVEPPAHTQPIAVVTGSQRYMLKRS